MSPVRGCSAMVAHLLPKQVVVGSNPITRLEKALITGDEGFFRVRPATNVPAPPVCSERLPNAMVVAQYS
jgi:hypothetical protein